LTVKLDYHAMYPALVERYASPPRGVVIALLR